jgi:hypothetical protein
MDPVLAGSFAVLSFFTLIGLPSLLAVRRRVRGMGRAAQLTPNWKGYRWISLRATMGLSRWRGVGIRIVGCGASLRQRECPVETRTA